MDLSLLGLWHRLYNFIMKCLETYSTKSVTLGHGPHQAAPQLPSSGAAPAISSSVTGQATHPTAQETPVEDARLYAEVEPNAEHKNVQDMGDSSISSAPSKEEKNDEEEAESAIAAEAQPPKKVVSINDTVEEMPGSWKKIKKNRRAEKVGSFDHEIEELSKPLKSILKVGSKLDENSIMNRTSSLESS